MYVEGGGRKLLKLMQGQYRRAQMRETRKGRGSFHRRHPKWGRSSCLSLTPRYGLRQCSRYVCSLLKSPHRPAKAGIRCSFHAETIKTNRFYITPNNYPPYFLRNFQIPPHLSSLQLHQYSSRLDFHPNGKNRTGEA